MDKIQTHITMPPQTVHGIFAITKTQIDTMIAAALAALVHIQGGTYMVNPFIQVGLASSSPVTFGIAFKTGTTPYVTGNSILATEMASITARSATAFSYTVKYYDGSSGSGNLVWIAIGEKA